MTKIENCLFELITIGLGNSYDYDLPVCDKEYLRKIASQQGVLAICWDGLQRLNEQYGCLTTIPKLTKLKWIATVIRQEQAYQSQWNAAKYLAELYGKHGIDTYVLKGFSLSLLYPNPEHRPCTDMDCYLMNRYEDGNRIVSENGWDVDCSYYKHSKIFLKGLTVENHQFLLPVKGSGKAKRFERELREWIDDGHNEYIGDSKLKATSPFFDAVYVLAHAQEHFLNEGIILRHVCDWAMVLNAHACKVDWEEWKSVCKEYGMLYFGYAMSRLAKRICGVTIPFDCPTDNKADRKLLDDILYRGVVANKVRTDMQVRMDLVKNMMCNSWKYRMFSDTNFLMFCGRRVWGYLFDKDLD